MTIPKNDLSFTGQIGLVALMLLASACTETGSKQPKEVVSRKPKTHESRPKEVKRDISRELDFFQRQNNETAEFSLEDEQFFTSMSPNPQPNSEAEAALAIGVVKYVLKLDVASNQYQEDELIKDESTPKQLSAKHVSLEALAIEKGIDFPAALKNNPLLINLQFYKLCLRAIKSSSNSLEYTNNINQTIANELRNWGQPKSESKVAQEEVVNEVSTNDWAHLHEIAADVRIGDNILLEAQMLADNRRFQDAINKVAQITQESPLFNQAKEKVIEFSDRAVQELRQKAAQAFQSSIPMADPRSRAAYLTRAKSHLEQALQDYPQAPAEQLSTVRENLAVISRDLEKLETGKESAQ